MLAAGRVFLRPPKYTYAVALQWAFGDEVWDDRTDRVDWGWRNLVGLYSGPCPPGPWEDGPVVRFIEERQTTEYFFVWWDYSGSEPVPHTGNLQPMTVEDTYSEHIQYRRQMPVPIPEPASLLLGLTGWVAAVATRVIRKGPNRWPPG